MKRLKLSVVLITLLSFTLNSCGVMFGGSRFSGTITVKDHPNAKIVVNGNEAGKGTVTGLYPRNKPLQVEVSEEGCETKKQSFENTFRTGNFILSLLTWGLAGIVIDLGTGAAFKPDHITNPAIQRISDKQYNFIVDYTGCPNN